MPKLIKDGALAQDHWQLIEHEQLQEGCNLAEAEQWLIPLAHWDEARQRLEPNQQRVGVWVTGDEPVEHFVGKLDNLPLITIKFPVFTDGRGFSLARQLRDKYHYSGELRAAGYILQDQLHYLHRCGFNAFLVADDADLPAFIASLHDFSDSYQAAVDQPAPLFRRRSKHSV